MTNKKDRPALFELVKKGPLKPDRKGALDTPGWFYKKKAAEGDDIPAPAAGAAASVRPIAARTDGPPATSVESTLPATAAASAGSAATPTSARSAEERSSTRPTADGASVRPTADPTSARASADSVGAQRAARAESAEPNEGPVTAEPIDAPGRVEPIGPPDAEVANEPTIEHEADRGLRSVEDTQEERLPARTVTITVPYWLVAVAALALVFVLLVAYRAGQKADRGQVVGSTAPANTADAPPSDALQDITEAPARGDALARRDRPTNLATSRPMGSRPVDQPSTGTGADRRLTARPPRAALPPRQPALPQKGQTLIICSSAKSSILLPVQNHFADNGLRTAIGKLGGMYVLYSGITVESTRDSQADALKTRVGRIGASYNKARPADALPFNLSTFESAYWANLNRIDKTPN